MTRTFGPIINEGRIAKGLNPIDFSVAKDLIREDRIGDSVINQYEGEPVFFKNKYQRYFQRISFQNYPRLHKK